MKNKVTKEALEKAKKELGFLKKEKRREVAEKLKLAISFGDLKENAAYHEAKDEQAFLEGRIMELEKLIKNSLVIEKTGGPAGVVEVGSRVAVLEGNKERQEYEIVSGMESDPLNGKISYDSPIGKALLGKRKGDICRVETPSGEEEFEILEIN